MQLNRVKFATVVGAAALAAGLSSAAWAGTATSNVAVTATVAQNCSITANPLAFGPYDPVTANAATAATTTATLDVNCTKGSTAITVQLDVGQHAAGNQKQMLGAVNLDNLQYNIFQPTTGVSGNTSCSATEWGPPSAALTVTPAVAWSATAVNSFTMCGSIPAAQNVSADSYSDTVVATITF